MALNPQPGAVTCQRSYSRDAAHGVVLIATRDAVLRSCYTSALQDRGFDIVTASSPANAERYLLPYKVRAIVIDGRILGPVSKERPGPILSAARRFPLVVMNASSLDPPRHALVFSYQATCVEDGADTDGVIRAVERSLRKPPAPGLPVMPKGRGIMLPLDDNPCFRTGLAAIVTQKDSKARGRRLSEVAAHANKRAVALINTLRRRLRVSRHRNARPIKDTIHSSLRDGLNLE